MQVLIIGNGGREHALAWKIAQSPLVKKIWVAPGNGGTGAEPKVSNLQLAIDNHAALINFAHEQLIDLTIVGPEAPLVAGIADLFSTAGLTCFGPKQQAAQLEGSKIFAKEFLTRHAIPTAAYASFNKNEFDAALNYIRQLGPPLVIKADGLAAGKGVMIAHDLITAETALRELLINNRFGAAGQNIVIEEFLTGEEVSFMVLAAGEQYLPLATAQDHKARDAGDRGPNTGGMGAYSPALNLNPILQERILRTVIEPTVHGLLCDGIDYLGFLYAGLMITPDGIPKVLEFNCRLGDPETQPILLRLRSDLIELIRAALSNQLNKVEIDWDPRPALGVVMAAQGYPGNYQINHVISGLDNFAPNITKVFHAGTRRAGEKILTNGGRVLCVTALGENIAMAQKNAYQVVEKINWEGAYWRPDIGYRAISI